MSAIESGIRSGFLGGAMYMVAKHTKLVNPGQAFLAGVIISLITDNESTKKNMSITHIALTALCVIPTILYALGTSITFQASLGLVGLALGTEIVLLTIGNLAKNLDKN